MYRYKPKYSLLFCLFAVFLLTGNLLFSNPSNILSATLVGTITSSVNGQPIIGAKIIVNNIVSRSVSSGVFSLNVEPAGTYSVSCSKPGYETYTSAPVIFLPGSLVSMNIQLQETANSSPLMLAVMDTASQRIYLSWEKPAGIYELIYDDGIQEKFSVWAQSGNMNSVKFTPAAYPVAINGCSIHLGQASNYPPGSNPFVPFQVVIFDDAGSGATPGNILAGPFDVLPTSLGWIDFSFPNQVNLTGGSFFIAMIQGGNAPNAAGIAIDETAPKFRSYFRYVNGSSTWIPASGNFMIRAIVDGPGGPGNLIDNPNSITGYQLWRLHQGEELNPQSWTSLGITTLNESVDLTWLSLPCGAHRWAVQTQYTGNRISEPTFSNVLGKCWTAPLSIMVGLSCTEASPAGVTLTLTNLVYPDTIYHAVTDNNGKVVFHSVWKGSYSLKAKKFGYLDHIENLSINAPFSVDVMLLQIKSPPTNLRVDSLSLHSAWDVPFYSDVLFHEDWSSGSFSTGGWIREGGTNWRISTSAGNPSPSAFFSWSPPVPGYEQSIISRPLNGENSPILKLSYDIFLDNFSTSALNQIAIEIHDGTSWHTLKIWNNAGGSFPWTTDELDISAYTNTTFKIRFRSFGEDSYQINGWYIDNILVTASESAHLLAPCILGYNFYLDNSLLATVSENSFEIPGAIIKYDSSYHVCVRAIYNSGYSATNCTEFTSGFLWPPTNLNAITFEDMVYLTWEKPMIHTDTGLFEPPGILGYNLYRNGNLLQFIPGANILSFYDTGLEPGHFSYTLNALYDLTPYGSTGAEAVSAEAGPATVMVHYGRLLPFSEPWNQGTFSFNDWRFTNGQANWIISQSIGNPVPAAIFSGLPAQTNYSFSLESPTMDASRNNCAAIWIDFDLKLIDNFSDGKEKLILEVFYNQAWHQKAEFINSGTTDWIPCHVDISAVMGSGFRFRFRTSGLNSANIKYWCLDNIEVYDICLPVTNLLGEAWGNDIRLTWSPPRCNSGGIILHQGFEESQFPPSGWSKIVQNQNASWSHSGISSPVGVHDGNFSAGLSWDYNHQDEWLIAHDVYVNGNLQFWSMAYQGSAHGDHYYVKVSTDHGSSWEILLDFSTLPPYPGTSGYNQWQQPYLVDMSSYLGDVVDIAWHADDNNGQGLWYYWGIDDCTLGGKKISINNDPPLYDLFRQNPSGGNFFKINSSPVIDTSYTDPSVPAGLYRYFILTVNEECTQSQASDTINVDVITSDAGHNPGQTKIFPNPAIDQIRIKSDFPVYQILIFNILGTKVLETGFSGVLNCDISLKSVPSGQYIIKVFTSRDCSTSKISVLK